MQTSMRTLSILGIAAALALTGCSGSDDATSDTGGEAPDTVRLVTYDSYAISEETLAAFSEETGFEVEIIRGSDAGEVVNRAILTKGNPEGDVLFGIDNTLLSRGLDEGIFFPHRAAGMDAVPRDLQLDPENRVTPVDTGEVCLNYDRAAFDAAGVEPPTTLDDLTDPRYRDMLVVQDPGISSPGLAFLLATIERYGEDGYLDYWQQLKDNGVEIAPGWSEAYYGQFSAASDGDRPIVVSYASSPAAEVMFAEEPLAESPTAAVLDGCYLQIEFAGVLANAANPEGARALVDFMLTPTYQNDIAPNNFVYPVVEGAELPQEFLDHAPQPADAVQLPPQQVAENRDQWVSDWTDLMRS